MDKRLLLVCASVFLLAGPVEALTLFGTSSKEYVDRAMATLDAKTTLTQIDSLNKTVMDKEKAVSIMSADLQKKALNAVTKLETKMQDLLDEQKRETELNIRLLQDLKARKQGDIKALEEALKQESSVLYYAKTANTVTFGYLGKVVGWAKNWAEVGREDIQSDIDNLKRNIADIERKITDEGARMRGVITSPEFQKSQAKLAAKLADASKELGNVQLIVAEVRQSTIFKPHNADADKLIAQLNDYIKKAKCDGITNIGTAKTASLDSCRAQYVEKITKSKAKIPACANLTAISSKDDFAACKKVL